MSLSIMGSVNTYTKTMKLQTQWNLKQQSGDYTSHKKSLDEWISTAQETLKKSRRGLYGNQDDDEEGNKKLNNIMQKIYAGKKLTQKERQYLQAKNPQAYEKLRASEQEQKAFEKKLRLCRTKEEVQRLKMTQLASSMAINASFIMISVFPFGLPEQSPNTFIYCLLLIISSMFLTTSPCFSISPLYLPLLDL